MIRSKSTDSLRSLIHAKPMIKSISSDSLHRNIVIPSALSDIAMEFQYESMMPAGLIGSACAINNVNKLPYKLDEFPLDLSIDDKSILGSCFACQPDDIVPEIKPNSELPHKYIELFVKIRRKKNKNK